MPNLTSRRELRLGLLLLAVLVVAGFVSVSFTRAQTPQAVDPQTAAEELRSSLTIEQQQAVTTALAAYKADMETIAKGIAAAMPGTASGQHRLLLPLVMAGDSAKSVVAGVRQSTMPQENPVKPDSTAVSTALKSVAPGLQDVQSRIEADLASILTSEQMALYQAAISSAAPTAAAQSTTQADDTIAQADLDPLLCFNSAQWANYGFAYITSAKAFAIMNAFNVDFGTETAVALQSYISYNESESYTLDGLQNLSTASVLLTATDLQVQNINGGTLFGVKGNADMVVAEARNDLARSLALTDYLASGGVIVNGVGIGGNYFAYFAYAYGEIANFYLDGSLLRTPGCF